MRLQRRGRWRHGVPIPERGPGSSYRPDFQIPSIFGAHQPGVATPQLGHLVFAALDHRVESRRELAQLLRTLSEQAERLMARHNLGWTRQTSKGRREIRATTGLTVTIGLGPAIFESGGEDRLGLRAARPLALRKLPAFKGDALDASLCGGDLCLQICAQDPTIAEEALSQLVAGVHGAAVTRWCQRGSLLRRDGKRPYSTPRDLLGFKSGTGNPRRGQDLDRHVWIAGGERSWMLGGTMLVLRRIEVSLQRWRALPAAAQEGVIGRHRDSGAPLGRSHEFERLALSEQRADELLIPADAHVRLAAPESNAGATMLRRSYSFDQDRDATHRGSGVLFLAFMRDPRQQYVPVQLQLAERDALSRFSRHVGSALFAIPPGAQPGRFLAEPLLSSATPA